MYQVPRKTYRDFHSDIFPDTNSYKSELLPKDWFAGKNLPLEKISLDPSKREGGEKPIIVSLIFYLPKSLEYFKTPNFNSSLSSFLNFIQQILRGNLKEVVSNMNNSAKNLTETAKLNQPILPVKNKIQLMELDQEKSKTESAEFLLKHKSITCQKLIENFDEEPNIVEVTAQNAKNGSHYDDSNGDQISSLKNGKIHGDIPPKPLPRKSISEQGSFEENFNNSIPKPRPRQATNNHYKVYTLFLFRFSSFFVVFF